MRATRDICQDCWYETRPDEYFPDVTRYGTCARCGYDFTLVTRVPVDCEDSPTGDHEASDTLCMWCLDYVVTDTLTPCPSPVERFHEASDTLCIWCLQYAVEENR